MKRRRNGYSLLEVVVAMAVFATFLAILFILTSEMRRYERRLPINFTRHPQIIGVIARVRRDVLDAHGRDPYLNSFEGYVASPQVLIVETVQRDGVHTIIWDFRQQGEIHRIDYKVGFRTEWVARGVPRDFSTVAIDAVKTSPDAAWATRITAKDQEGRLAIDQILQPRATE